MNDSHKPPVLKNSAGGKQDAHNSYYGKEECCEPQNWGQQPQPTGTEGQTGNTGAEQNQNGNDYDFDRKRLPKRAEEKIKEKLDQYLNQPPPGGVGIPPGFAGAIAAAAGRPDSGYGPSPSPSPYSNVPSHQSQPSYSGSIGGTFPVAPGWSAPAPPPGQYGAPVQGQTTYTQQTPFNPQSAPGQYRGHGHP